MARVRWGHGSPRTDWVPLYVMLVEAGSVPVNPPGANGWTITAARGQATDFTEEDAVAFVMLNMELLVKGSRLWIES